MRGEIEALTAEIERLSKENQYLKDENYVIQKQVEAEQGKVAEMVVVNTELTKQVAVGSRIFFKALGRIAAQRCPYLVTLKRLTKSASWRKLM